MKNNNGLGIDPVTVTTIASQILPGLLQNKYAPAQDAIDQVNSLVDQNTQDFQQIEVATNQIIDAYERTIDGLNDKRLRLSQLPDAGGNTTFIKGLAIGAVVLAAGALIIDRKF